MIDNLVDDIIDNLIDNQDLAGLQQLLSDTQINKRENVFEIIIITLIYNSSVEFMQHVLREINVNSQTKIVRLRPDHILTPCIKTGSVEKLQLLLDYKHSGCYIYGDLIASALKHQQHEIVGFLMDRLFDANDKNDCEDIFVDAILDADTEIVQLFLDRNIKITEKALRATVKAFDSESLQLLIDYGADIHVNNDIVLYKAIVRHALACVKILLQAGADVQAAYSHYENRKHIKSDAIELANILSDERMSLDQIIALLTVKHRS